MIKLFKFWKHVPKGFIGLASKKSGFHHHREIKYYNGKDFITLGYIYSNLEDTYGWLARAEEGQDSGWRDTASGYWGAVYAILKGVADPVTIEFVLAQMLGGV